MKREGRIEDRRLDGDSKPARLYRTLLHHAGQWLSERELIDEAGVTSALSSWLSSVRKASALPAGWRVSFCTAVKGKGPRCWRLEPVEVITPVAATAAFAPTMNGRLPDIPGQGVLFAESRVP